jgi:hypothetical protein
LLAVWMRRWLAPHVARHVEPLRLTTSSDEPHVALTKSGRCEGRHVPQNIKRCETARTYLTVGYIHVHVAATCTGVQPRSDAPKIQAQRLFILCPRTADGHPKFGGKLADKTALLTQPTLAGALLSLSVALQCPWHGMMAVSRSMSVHSTVYHSR